MKPGQYIAIPTDDLELPDSPEHWIKGQEYRATVEPGGEGIAHQKEKKVTFTIIGCADGSERKQTKKKEILWMNYEPMEQIKMRI